MKKLIRKVLALPNLIYNWIVLKYRHVTYGDALFINGRIYCVSNNRNGISIGRNVRINSCISANPIGASTRTILFAKGSGKILIGNNCGISNAVIFATKSIEIGNDVLIGGGTRIYDTDFHWLDYDKRMREPGGDSKSVRIKDGAFIGADCIILKGVTVGEQCVVGAGSVVTKNIPDYEIWGGNPAKFIRHV